MILDLLDKTEDLLAFQRVCNEWREVLLSYVMDGRLKSRALVSILFLFFALAILGLVWEYFYQTHWCCAAGRKAGVLRRRASP